MTRKRSAMVCLLPLLGCAARPQPASCPAAPAPAPGQVIGVEPGAIEWRPAPPNVPRGAEVALLEGDPAADGIFTLRIRLPEDYVLAPHTHARDERVTVLEGSVLVGFGSRKDAAETARARRYGAGSYYVNPAALPHFVFTDEPALIQITTTGPWTLDYIQPAAASETQP